MCPRCRQSAPIVYRGMAATCAACGAPRVPLMGTSVTHAGKGSKLGGAVARAFGWTVLTVGLSVALVVTALLQWVVEGGYLGYAIGAPVALAALVLGTLLLRGGRTLHQRGTGQEKGTRTAALLALAQARSGMLTAADAAQALAIPVGEADALLTELAKTTPEQVSLEIDDAGGLYYRFPRVLGAWQGHGVRVDADVGAPGVRVAASAPGAAPADAGEELLPSARHGR